MIFISHKFNPDHKYALKLKEVLASNGIDSWIAPEDVSAGQNFAYEIPRVIKACECFVLVLTNESQYSTHISKEVNFAIKYNKRIVPVCISSTKIELTDEYDYLLQNVQIKTVDFEKEDFLDLINELKADAPIYSIEIEKDYSFTMIKGDFQQNIKFIIDNHLLDLKKTFFAMGIDKSSHLELSSKGGIIRSVCDFLQEEYSVSLDFLQKEINKAKRLQLKHSSDDLPMRYGDIVCIRVPLDKDFLQLMLICNSNQKNANDNLDDIEGIDSRLIILKIFNKCAELGEKASNLMIGAIGTNGLSFPYEVITAEIINAYIYSVRQKIYPHNLYFSVRLKDMENSSVKPEKVYKYISGLTQFI